jgi:hypothetical protein
MTGGLGRPPDQRRPGPGRKDPAAATSEQAATTQTADTVMVTYTGDQVRAVVANLRRLRIDRPLGCPVGCEPGSHSCGVGEPIRPGVCYECAAWLANEPPPVCVCFASMAS